MPLIVAAVAMYYWNRSAGPRFHGKTAAEWESEISQWGDNRDPQVYAAYIRPPPRWRVYLNKFLGDEWINAECEFVENDLVLEGDDPQAIPILIELAKSRDPRIRALATWSLGAIHKKTDVE